MWNYLNICSIYKLKYNEDYSYLIVATDHHQKQGKKSSENSIKTHKKVKKIKKIKAKAGESIVDLEWVKHELAVKYKIYQNQYLIFLLTLMLSMTNHHELTILFSLFN